MLFRLNHLLIIFILLSSLYGQRDYDKELNNNRSRLDQIKEEIESIRKQISETSDEKSTITQQIALIDKETALIARARGLLERENKIIERKIEQTNERLHEAKIRLEKLKALYAQRAVYAYKYGRIRNLELLLTSASFNQALIRFRYLKMIAEHDERTIRSIKKKKNQIAFMREKLAEDLDLKKKNLREKQREENRYLARKSKKEALLKKLNWTQSLYKKRLGQKEQEKERIIGIILALERSRKLRERRGEQEDIVQFDFEDIVKARGKLPWPVKGKILTRYGKQRDPLSKTYTKNTDIEIQSALGTPVKSVFSGVVSMITYLPAYGNTVIIHHGKSFYTVYSHLDEIYVHKDDIVKTGQTIATVGDSGSLSGSKLQFGIYGGQRTYNPEDWLR